MLGVVRGLNAWANPELAPIRREQPADQAQQHRLAGAVRPHHAHALAVLDQSDRVEQHDPLAKQLIDTAQLHGLRTAAHARPKLQRHPAPLQHRAIHLIHAVDLALLVAGLLDVALAWHQAGPQLEAGDRRLQPLDLFLLGHKVGLLLQQSQLLLRHKCRVVALVAAQRRATLRRVELGDDLHRLVEQVAIVRDQHYSAAKRADDRLQQRLALHIQMVVGLVEQQQVGLADQAARQPHKLALPAAEQSHRALPVLFIQAQLAQQLLGAPVQRGAAKVGEAIQQARVLVEHRRQRAHIVGQG